MAPPVSFKKAPPASNDVEKKLEDLWGHSINDIASIEPGTTNWKQQVLPLARIKKIMKSDEAVYAEIERENATSSSSDTPTLTSNNNSRFMIASEAPILLGKACELLVKEITIRSWRHTERNRRRTLQKQDVHTAVGESEVYDFLIDIVPRVPLVGKSFVSPDVTSTKTSSSGGGVGLTTNSDVQSQATAALEQAMANQQAQETNAANAAQAQIQYNMMIQQHQQMQAVEAVHAANATGVTDSSTLVNQQIPQQMMMYMPQISWQTQTIPQQQQQQQHQQQQQQQQQQHLSAVPMLHNSQHRKLEDVDNSTPDLQKS